SNYHSAKSAKPALAGDTNGDAHYDIISAFKNPFAAPMLMQLYITSLG
ncbi:hypothetical protein Lpp227_07001, partial [Lacticaseibacillus paracasei subsp. paracasei Lpp227]